ncbi:MAG TPA: hypothetical protein VIM70_06570 [Clostridium sp.]
MRKKSKNDLSFMGSILVITVYVFIGFQDGKELEKKLIKRRKK